MMTKVKEGSKEWWEGRYQQKEFLFGKEPSAFLAEHINELKAGETLDIAAGEGRNAVYLALKGHQVKAVDFSSLAGQRAAELAKESGVAIEVSDSSLDFFLIPIMRYQNIVVIDYHPTPALLKSLARGLASGGTLLVDAFLTKEVQKNNSKVETFECFRENELLNAIRELQIIFYDERVVDNQPFKVRCLAKKTAR